MADPPSFGYSRRVGEPRRFLTGAVRIRGCPFDSLHDHWGVTDILADDFLIENLWARAAPLVFMTSVVRFGAENRTNHAVMKLVNGMWQRALGVGRDSPGPDSTPSHAKEHAEGISLGYGIPSQAGGSIGVPEQRV